MVRSAAESRELAVGRGCARANLTPRVGQCDELARTLVVTITGNVTSGLFVGDTVIRTSTGPATDILTCILGLGSVSSVYSLVTLEITSW